MLATISNIENGVNFGGIITMSNQNEYAKIKEKKKHKYYFTKNEISDSLFLNDNIIYIEKNNENKIENKIEDFSNFSPDDTWLIAASIYSNSVLETVIARNLVKALTHKMNIPQDINDNIEIATHEVMSNAVIHGNFDIHKEFNDINGFEKYCNAINDKKSCPINSKKRINVIIRKYTDNHCSIYVQDEGESDSHWGNEARKAFKPSMHGLGFFLISECTNALVLLKKQRALEMHFRW